MKYALFVALAAAPTFVTAQFPTSAATRNRIWTVAEVKTWSTENKNQRWHGQLLYQGSDSIRHYFISRIMDERIWFTLKRTDIALPEEKPLRKISHAPLGYYYVDPQQNFVKTGDY